MAFAAGYMRYKQYSYEGFQYFRKCLALGADIEIKNHYGRTIKTFFSSSTDRKMIAHAIRQFQKEQREILKQKQMEEIKKMKAEDKIMPAKPKEHSSKSKGKKRRKSHY